VSDHRTGFVTQTGMALDDALPRAAELEFDYVEVVLDGDHERTCIDPDAVRALADDHGLDLLVHLPFALDIASPFEHVRAGSRREVAAAIDTAAAFDAEKAVLHASSHAWSPAWDRETVQRHLLDAIRDLDAHASDRGVEICVENLKNRWFDIHEFPDLFDDTDASMCLDTGHAYVDGFDSGEIASFVADHPDRVSHVHVNDTRSTDRDEHLPFGSGFIDFEQVFAPLESATLSLEVFTLDWGHVEYSKQRLDEVLERI
jgi:sugar phosphate isomerase/epimerase